MIEPQQSIQSRMRVVSTAKITSRVGVHLSQGPQSSSITIRNWPAMARGQLADTLTSALDGRPGLPQRVQRVVEARRIAESGGQNQSKILSAVSFLIWPAFLRGKLGV